MILWGMWCIPYNTCIKYFRCFILWSCHQPENEPIPYLHLVVLYRAGTWGRKLLTSQWSRHTSALTLGGCPQVTRDDRAYCCLLSFQHLKWQLQYTKNDLVMAKMLLLFYSFTNISVILHLTGDGCIFVEIWMTQKQFNLLEDCTYSLWIKINLHRPLKAEENLFGYELLEDIHHFIKEIIIPSTCKILFHCQLCSF